LKFRGCGIWCVDIEHPNRSAGNDAEGHRTGRKALKGTRIQ